MKNDFSEWVRTGIKKTGLTWLQLEKCSGIDAKRFYVWTSGRSRPRLESFVMLCESFAKHQDRTFTEILMDGLQHLPEFQGALHRGHK